MNLVGEVIYPFGYQVYCLVMFKEAITLSALLSGDDILETEGFGSSEL